MKKYFKTCLFGFSATLICVSILFSDTLTTQNQDQNLTKSKLETLQKLAKTLAIIEQYYIDDLDLDTLVNKSLEGLLSNLDAHSSFLNEKSLKDLQVQTKGEFGGLGINIGIKDGALTIIAPIEDTPADRAGLKSGDIILKINDTSTLNLTIDEAISMMRGEPKTSVDITVVRKNENKPLKFTIERDIIKINSVYSKIIEDENILYIRVTNFDKNVAQKSKEIIMKNRDVKGIILDLRNNPGGLLDQSIELTNLFVEKGLIVSQKGKIQDENIEFNAKPENKITNLPLIVLVNGGSASASEIVSGSIQDHKRGIIIGENTFGKGSVQVLLPINETEGLRLTTSRYYLPTGRTIQAVGIIPDVIVHPGKVPYEEEMFSIKENELKKHLENELEKTLDKKKDDKKNNDKDSNKTESKSKEIITKQKVFEDLQLKTAIDTIKVLNITKPQE